jgi:diacylglycerol kinase family enzyme
MASPIPVIINGSAGKGYATAELEAIAAAFTAAGIEARILAAKNGAEIAQYARQAVQEGHAVIVAGGGDGTISTVAGTVAGSGSALGVLALGTLNHFAKDLKIPLDLEGAARTIAANHRIAVDVGEVNGRVFINNSSLGLYPAMVTVRENQRRRLGRTKWHALFWATLTVLRRHPMLDLRLILDELAQDRRTPLVFVGNNEYKVEGFDVGTRERLDAGELSIYLTRRRGRRGLLGLALRALFGMLKQTRDFEALRAQTLTIATRHKLITVATDGEVTVMQTPLDYRIRPRALRVIAPAPGAP